MADSAALAQLKNEAALTTSGKKAAAIASSKAYISGGGSAATAPTPSTPAPTGNTQPGSATNPMGIGGWDSTNPNYGTNPDNVPANPSNVVADPRAPAGWGIDTTTGHFAKLPSTDTTQNLPPNPLTVTSSDLLNPTPTQTGTTSDNPTGTSLGASNVPGSDVSLSDSSTPVGSGGTAGAGGVYSTTQPISGPSEFQSLAQQLGVNGTTVKESQYFTRKKNPTTGVDDIYLNEAGAVKLAGLHGMSGTITTGTGVDIPTAGIAGNTIILPDGTKFQVPDLTQTYQSILAGLNPQEYTQKLQAYQDTYLKPIYDELQQNEDQINASLDAIVTRKGLDRANAANFFMTAASLASVTSADTQPLEDLISVLDQKRQIAIDTLSMREDDLGRYADGLKFETQTKEEALTLAMQATQNVYSQIQAYSSAYSAMIENQVPKQTGAHVDDYGNVIPDYSVWDAKSKSWVPYTGGSSSTSDSSSGSPTSGGSYNTGSSGSGVVDAASLSDAIKAQESGGSYTIFGHNGTSYGAYQFKQPTWNTVYSQYAKATGASPSVPKWGTSAMTPAIQDAVAQWKMQDLMNKGNTAEQVANIWNSSLGGIEKPLPNSAVQYAKQVMGRLGNTTTTTDAQGNSVRSSNVSTSGYMSFVAAKKVATNYPLMSNALKELPDGTAYINSSSLTTRESTFQAEKFSKQTGVPIINADNANDLDALVTTSAQIQTTGNYFGNIAATDSTGGNPLDPYLFESAQGKVALQNIGDPLNALFNTPRGQALKTYDNYSGNLYGIISSLAGSHPRVTGFEFGTAKNYLPSSKDTLIEGAKKLVRVQTSLDNSIRTYIPNYVGTPVQVGTQWAVGDANQNIKLFSSESAAYGALSSLYGSPGKTNVGGDTNKAVSSSIGSALQSFKAKIVGAIKPTEQVVQVALGKTTATVNAAIASRLQSADAEYFRKTGQHFAISESFRTPEHQTELYKKLSKKGAQVAPPGYSFHQIGMAVDVGNNWKSYAPFLRKYGFKNSLPNDRGHFSIGEFS